MKAASLLVPLVAFAVAACQQKSEEAAAVPASGLFGKPSGRYVGVGHFNPSELWTQIVRQAAEGGPAAANADDDDEIIVVLDSKTGEVRQCGNLSGYCIGFNPWARPLGEAQRGPVPLLKHREQLRQEAQAAMEEAERAANARRRGSP